MKNTQAIRIEVHRAFEPLRDDWLALQSHGITTLYQAYEWCCTWHQVIGATNGVEPRIVVGRDPSDRIVFILPFGIYRHGGYRVAEWLASDLATYGFGVYDRTFLESRPDAVLQHWPQIVKALQSVDALWLRHVPEHWGGVPHPLKELFTTRSANQTFQLRLDTDYETLYAAKRSAESRRKVRKRDERLLASGDIQICLPRSPADADRLLDAMFAQQSEQLASRGVYHVFDDRMPEFVRRLADQEGDSQVSVFPQYLTLDGELVAAKMGIIFGRTYWAMISSTSTELLGKHSPGDFALRSTIRACCECGLELFDFATGNSTYKKHWADSSVALHEVIVSRSARGMLWVAAKRASVDAKRAIKESEFWWPAFTRLRQAALGSKAKD